MDEDSDLNFEETLRSNGEVVIGALKDLNGPVTVKDVVHYLAVTNELDPVKIETPVSEILTTWYNMGFVEKNGQKFALQPGDGSRRRKRRKSTQSGTRRSQSRRRSQR